MPCAGCSTTLRDWAMTNIKQQERRARSGSDTSGSDDDDDDEVEFPMSTVAWPVGGTAVYAHIR